MNKIIIKRSDLKNTLKTFVAITCLSSILSANADDTEVFFSANEAKPNLLFVLDNSGSMNRDIYGEREFEDYWNTVPNPLFRAPTRLNILKNAVQSVLADSPDNVNIGVMRFGPGENMVPNIFKDNNGQISRGSEDYIEEEGWRTHGVSGVAFPLTDINTLAREVIPHEHDVYGLPYYPAANETVRDYVSQTVNSWQAVGGTPLVDALFEAASYFRGDKVHYGYDSPTGKNKVGAHPSTYSGNVISNDIYYNKRNYSNAPNYTSPISSSCQNNFIVLMSDGEPTYYYGSPGDWSNPNYQHYAPAPSRPGTRGSNIGPLAFKMRGHSQYGPLAANLPTCASNPSGFRSGKCGPELTQYIADHDNSSAMDDVQTIKTYTIGFGSGMSQDTINYLRSLETIDDDPETEKIEDGFFNASEPGDLVKAFKDIVQDVVTSKSTLASPGYSVNVQTGLKHEDTVYIPVFDRGNSSRWSGNLKKFKLVEVGNRRIIQGKNGKEATDELGGFTKEAWDYWSESTVEDGKDALGGGAASLLTDPNSRHLYSNITSSSDLTAAGNQLKATNSHISNALLGLDSSTSTTYRKRVINFIRGWQGGNYNANANPKGVARKHLGDMLHTEPYIYTYAEGEQTIFVATNEGYLHAFDTNTGEEQFAFMPKELLKNIAPQMRNEGTAKDHLYGVDGAINVWHDTESGKVYLFFGLRRGGRSYYALDVTDVNSPQLMWSINNEDTGYSNLGQSWSPIYLGKVGYGTSGDARAAVIVSGGYDPIEDRDIPEEPGSLDDASSEVTTTMGNDIFIVDAKNGGEPLWSLQATFPGEVTDSIPGGVRYLDTNYNGKVDRMYFADTGGHVWRVDLSEKIKDNDQLSKLTLLASLGGDGSDSRKFYNEPDVALMKLNGKRVFIVSIGSGFRAHPLDKSIDDKFFVLVDDSPYKPIDVDNYTVIRKNLLAKINITDAGEGEGASISLPDGTIADHRGWKVSFPENGEKVLSTALAFDGNITFTTLVPDAALTGNGVDPCTAPSVQGRFYAINVLTGKAGLYLNSEAPDPDPSSPDAEIPDSDVRSAAISNEPPGSPQAVFNDLEVDEAAGTCRHPVDIRIGRKLSQVTGYDTCRLESVYWSAPVKN